MLLGDIKSGEYTDFSILLVGVKHLLSLADEALGDVMESVESVGK